MICTCQGWESRTFKYPSIGQRKLVGGGVGSAAEDLITVSIQHHYVVARQGDGLYWTSYLPQRQSLHSKKDSNFIPDWQFGVV